MGEFVTRETLLLVLQAYGVTVTPGTDGRHTLRKGSVLEVHFLPDTVSRHLVGRFARKFDVPVTHIWNPTLIPKDIRPPGLMPN